MSTDRDSDLHLHHPTADPSVRERVALGERALPRLYEEFAPWFHLLTAPEEYLEDAEFYLNLLKDACDGTVRTLLELGSGGGNVASHLKRELQLTLVDLSPEMLEVSAAINPEVEHVVGDMRSVRLGRQFDAVLIQDAISYMSTTVDLRQALVSAFEHVRVGGAAIFAPDHIRETFVPTTDCGGYDGKERALRYLEWLWDPDPTDDMYTQDFAYLLRQEDGSVHAEHDRHIMGLFGRDAWLSNLREIGFSAKAVVFNHSEVPPGSHEIFLASKTADEMGKAKSAS